MSIYLRDLNFVSSRLLSLINMEQTSRTNGSFDRTFWCWKFTDFSAPRMQEGIFTLEWLISNTNYFTENESAKLRKHIHEAIDFWTSLQNKNGSFDEAYPNEQCVAATAFTLFYVGSVIKNQLFHMDADLKERALSTVKGAANWLCDNDETHGILSNHLSAAAAALQVAYEIVGEKSFLIGRDKFLKIIYNYQTKNGFYFEYSGPDPGYQTHCMFYLCYIHQSTNCEYLKDSLLKSYHAIKHFILSDGSCGGSYASRGTTFLFPAPFEYIKSIFDVDDDTLYKIRENISEKKNINPLHVDQWNFFPLINNYFYASNWEYHGELTPKQQVTSYTKVFKEEGWIKIVRDNSEVVINASLGGSFKINYTDGGIIDNNGYFYKYKSHSFISQMKSEYRISQDEDAIEIVVKSKFKKSKNVYMTPLRFIFFRIFMLTAGSNKIVADYIKKFLVFMLINKQTIGRGELIRKIKVSATNISVLDEIKNCPEKPEVLERNVPYHMGSARYVNISEYKKFLSNDLKFVYNLHADNLHTFKFESDL